MRHNFEPHDCIVGVTLAEMLERWEGATRRELCRQLEERGICFDGGQFFSKLFNEKHEGATEELFEPFPRTGTDWNDASSTMGTEVLLAEAKRRVTIVDAQVVVQSVPSQVRVTWPEWEMYRNAGPSFPPATSAVLQAVEEKLGVSLPPAYREFLGLTNGWVCSFCRIVGASEIDWASNKSPDWIAGWNTGEAAFPDRIRDIHALEQQSNWLRRDYLGDLLQISAPIEELDQHVFLCPRNKLSSGEWEAWEMSVAIAGAKRFRSFAELLADLELRDDNYFDMARRLA